jgi:hypothetical protein
MNSFLFAPRLGAIACAALLTACSGSSTDPVASDSAANNNAQSQSASWQVNGVAYTSTARSTATSESSELTIVGVGTDGADEANGGYAGSNLLIAHSLTSPGEYRIADSLNEFTASLKSNPGEKVAHIAVTVGTAVLPVAATRYESAGSGTLMVTIDENGDYHFTSDQPIALNKVSDLGDGVPDAPQTAEVLLNDIHDLQ